MSYAGFLLLFSSLKSKSVLQYKLRCNHALGKDSYLIYELQCFAGWEPPTLFIGSDAPKQIRTPRDLRAPV